MEENIYWVWLSRMKSLGIKTFEKLLSNFGSLKNIWKCSFKELSQLDYLNKNNIIELSNIEYKKNLEQYLTYMEQHNIHIISMYDKRYPSKLHLIEYKPIVLYAKGNVDNLNNETVAIVGSRKCTEYGRKNAEYFAYELGKRGVNVVSGLALGIDSYAHIGALKSNAKTIAILGNGLDSIYPEENLALAKKILNNNGAIISEFVIGTKPERANFPRRNRIITGISNSVIVVEAGIKSGSLITANYAINQGKEVWAIPGNISSISSKGTNELIKDGANVLTCLDDILR